MVERRICSFCGAEVEPGTGKMYVKRDGTVLTFDSNKCYINMVKMGRVPRRTTWTRAYAVVKSTAKGAAAVAAKKEADAAAAAAAPAKAVEAVPEEQPEAKPKVPKAPKAPKAKKVRGKPAEEKKA
jgi:large subunit ribosomal protein L24e